MDAVRRIGTTLALLAALPLAVKAQTVQKCVGRDGHVRYQSAPCAKGERTEEVWTAAPDPVAAGDDVPTGDRTRRSTPRAASRPRGSRSAMLERRVAQVSGGDCDRARAYRDAVERRAGLDRDYDLLTTLQRRVYDACR